MKRTRIEPLQALTHPAWIAALVVLVFNDHFLKASELAPALSGKLSDFAGLLVAPVLLAALMRVRSERGVWLSGAAVGFVFSAINLSPTLAAGWDAAVSIVVPFHTTVDPTDLIALVMLPVGVYLFRGAMKPRPAASARSRRVQMALAAVGVLFCSATSTDESCSTDSDCVSGDVCVNEWCEAPTVYCDSDADCPEAHLQCAAGECSYRPTCNANADCPSGSCEDGRCDLAGVPIGGSSSMMTELEASSIDELSRTEVQSRPLQSIDPALLDYLHDDAPAAPASVDAR